MGGGGNVGALPCKLSPAAASDVQCDYHSPAGNVSFNVAIYKGAGSVAFSAFSLDGQKQSLATPLSANLTVGQHKLAFVLAFSDPSATAVIREACNPTQDLVLVDAASPYDTLRICVP
jgi:hypothetical protein